MMNFGYNFDRMKKLSVHFGNAFNWDPKNWNRLTDRLYLMHDSQKKHLPSFLFWTKFRQFAIFLQIVITFEPIDVFGWFWFQNVRIPASCSKRFQNKIDSSNIIWVINSLIFFSNSLQKILTFDTIVTSSASLVGIRRYHFLLLLRTFKWN